MGNKGTILGLNFHIFPKRAYKKIYHVVSVGDFLTASRVQARTLPEGKCLISMGAPTLPMRCTVLQKSLLHGISEGFGYDT